MFAAGRLERIDVNQRERRELAARDPFGVQQQPVVGQRGDRGLEMQAAGHRHGVDAVAVRLEDRSASGRLPPSLVRLETPTNTSRATRQHVAAVHRRRRRR